MEKEKNVRLNLYTSLFGKEKDSKDHDSQTGLKLTPSLNYSLQTFLYLLDHYWVLAIIDVNELSNHIETIGEQHANHKLKQIGTVIKQFCENDARRLKGFKCNDLILDNDNTGEYGDKHELFAVLMYCRPNLTIAPKYIEKLLKKIQSLTNWTVSAGVAKMNEWETFDEWKKRAYRNLKHGEEKSILETQQTNETFFSDIDVNYVNPNQGDEKEEKHAQQAKEQQGGVVNKLGNKEEFESKMKEIANNEDYEWIFGLMEIDDFELFIFNNNNNKEIIENEMKKIENEMFHLFDIFGNKKNAIKYLGYKLNVHSSKYGLILYDSKDRNKCFIAAHSITETLSSEIRMKCAFSVSIGSSRLIEDDLGMIDDLIERLNNNLKQAKKHGENKVCFAIGIDTFNVDDDDENVDIKCDQENLYNSITDDDAIEQKSLGVIEVCLFVCICFLWLSHLDFQ